MSTVNSYLPKVGDVLRIGDDYIRVISMSRLKVGQHGRPIQRLVWSPFEKGKRSEVIGREPAVVWDFYWVPCSKTGSLKKTEREVKRYGAANVINHSNMLGREDQDQATFACFKPLKEYRVFHQCASYSWHETGILALDQYISQVDDRYQLWCDVLKPNRAYWKVELYQFAWNFHYTKLFRAKIVAETGSLRHAENVA
jgi:hypothetical protein